MIIDSFWYSFLDSGIIDVGSDDVAHGSSCAVYQRALPNTPIRVGMFFQEMISLL